MLMPLGAGGFVDQMISGCIVLVLGLSDACPRVDDVTRSSV